MHVYGQEWHEALGTVLKRLALDEGPGFLVLEGPNGSGKTDLMNLVRELANDESASKKLRDDESRHLAALVKARNYICVDLTGSVHCKHSALMAVFQTLVRVVHSNGAAPGQPFLIMFDDIGRSMASSDKIVNQQFLQDLCQPLEMYQYVTFLCSATIPNLFSLSLNLSPDHILALDVSCSKVCKEVDKIADGLKKKLASVNDTLTSPSLGLKFQVQGQDGAMKQPEWQEAKVENELCPTCGDQMVVVLSPRKEDDTLLYAVCSKCKKYFVGQ